MFDGKYRKVLTIVLLLVVILVIILLAFLGYDIYRKYFIEKEVADVIEQFENGFTGKKDKEDKNDDESGSSTNPSDLFNQTEYQNDGEGTSAGPMQYKGFNMMGTIKIPKTGIEYPILESVTKKSIEVAVAILYGPGLNQPGNTVIVGHNYRNGLFFSDNKKLENGDLIYIKDLSGKTLTYKIYNTFITTPEDADYVVRQTNGATEISLSTCTDDSNSRLIICAKATGE